MDSSCLRKDIVLASSSIFALKWKQWPYSYFIGFNNLGNTGLCLLILSGGLDKATYGESQQGTARKWMDPQVGQLQATNAKLSEPLGS